ncbi:hypothetical protein R6Q57_008439 [Mikania cordata]
MEILASVVVEVDIVVTATVVAISVLPFVKLPRYSPVVPGRDYYTGPFMKGSCSELYHLPIFQMGRALLLEGFDSKEEDDDHTVEVNSLTNQSHLFNIPFHLLEMIMEFCGDIDYVNFRATFKQLRAPVTRWGNGSSMRRLQRYSLVSPWLMVLDNDHGIITFIDPMFGDPYSVRTPPELNGDDLKKTVINVWLVVDV